MADNTLFRDLGDGLVLRQATAADVEAVASFNACVHSDVGWDKPDVHVAAWVRDLMTQPHPTFKVGDFLVVEDTANGAIVSSTNLISQTWSYGGIELGVGRPELVGTHPDYRRRGLVRAQFEVLHQWSAERGHQLQAITGIPWYYRQFGYEMTMNLHGGLRGPVSSVPALKDGQEEAYRIRRAAAGDLAFIRQVDGYAQQRYLVHCVRDEILWRYELEGRSPESAGALRFEVIETAAGEPVGFIAYMATRWANGVYLRQYELAPGVSWWAVTPAVLRHVKKAGAEIPLYMEENGSPPLELIGLSLGPEHPVYPIVADWLPWVSHPYAWYIRVPDVPGFLTTIVPVLERRLADSVLVGHTGSLGLDFYRGGARVMFEGGRIVDIVPWPWDQGGDSDRRAGGAFARFPDLTFLHVLFGYRSFAELERAYADCGGNLEGRLLVSVLFPKQDSAIWPVS